MENKIRQETKQMEMRNEQDRYDCADNVEKNAQEKEEMSHNDVIYHVNEYANVSQYHQAVFPSSARFPIFLLCLPFGNASGPLSRFIFIFNFSYPIYYSTERIPQRQQIKIQEIQGVLAVHHNQSN